MPAQITSLAAPAHRGACVGGTVTALPTRPRTDQIRDRTHRNALNAALRKAAILDRLDPRGDAYGAAGQALADFVEREDQIVARGEDVSGWISTATERRWINELRYQGRRSYERLDAPLTRDSSGTLGDITPNGGLALEEVVELREHIHGIGREQRDALAHLRAAGVQERHVRVVELALKSDLTHHEIAAAVNAEFSASKAIQSNTVTVVLRRQRERLVHDGAFGSVVRRLRRTQQAA